MMAAWSGTRPAALVTLAVVAVLAACASPAQRYERRALALGFAPVLLHGDGFDHRSYVAGSGSSDTTLHVYVEHDGTPWASLDRIAADPTPRTPYVLELMAKDAGARLLLGRPCYFGTQTAAPCSPLLWTHERYSQAVVTSMVAALRGYLSAHPFHHLVLVGYSGGGTLAWLMAAKLPETTHVVTLAANLDIDTWAALHGYSALAGSLNPAAAAKLSAAVSERHYAGGRDTNVPTSVLRAFARAHPGATVIDIAGFDHNCCWIEHWPQLLTSAEGVMSPALANAMACVQAGINAHCRLEPMQRENAGHGRSGRRAD